MKEVPGTDKIFDADIVLIALGFIGPERTISKLLNVKHDLRSTIETAGGVFNTNVANLYAAGGIGYSFFL